jgi:hypothetical protein
LNRSTLSTQPVAVAHDDVASLFSPQRLDGINRRRLAYAEVVRERRDCHAQAAGLALADEGGDPVEVRPSKPPLS